MAFCAERNVGVSFLSEHGCFLARIQGPVHGNVLPCRNSISRADTESDFRCPSPARFLAKIANGRSALLRAAREHSSETPNGPGTIGRFAAVDRVQRYADAFTRSGGDAAWQLLPPLTSLSSSRKKYLLLPGNAAAVRPLDNVNALPCSVTCSFSRTM